MGSGLLRKFYENHVLANATFVVVLLVGTLIYSNLPRSQDPEINFNWISIITILPGGSASDVEKLITNPLEEAIAQVQDIKFVLSNSRDGSSTLLVRFNDISDRIFDKRLNDLRREVQAKANAELPASIDDPTIIEITSANSFPTATLVLVGEADDEVLRRTAASIRTDLERIKGVDGAATAGLSEPELHVEFSPRRLVQLGIAPSAVAETVRSQFQDVAAGDLEVDSQAWIARVLGADVDPAVVGNFRIVNREPEVLLSSVAEVYRSHEDPAHRVQYRSDPAVMFAVTKQAYTNTLDVVDRLRGYIESKNSVLTQSGLQLVLIDDQTALTQHAIAIMQNNLVLGLLLVAGVTWIFLGLHIAFFIGIGIPFTLAGTFWVLSLAGQTVNQPVLLGVVIVLGMLVDDAVVVVEAIYYRLQRGAQGLDAALASLKEVFAPVTSSILTTIAAFLPLMLMPGILGQFMFVIPFVVSVALAVSLIEAYWMLPVHVASARVRFTNRTKIQLWRERFNHRIRLRYSQLLIKVLRRPVMALIIFFLAFVFAIGLFVSDAVKFKFFAFDTIRLFYINVEMPPDATLDQTLIKASQIESIARNRVGSGELRESVSVAGQMFTEMEPFFGDAYGQVMVSLLPKTPQTRDVEQIIESMRAEVMAVTGARNVSFLVMSGGPPAAKPISVKVRGDDYDELRNAADALRKLISTMPAVRDIADDDAPGKPELLVRLDKGAIQRAGLQAGDVARSVRLFFEGEIVARTHHQGEKLEVRVRAVREPYAALDDVLRQPIALPGGGQTTLGQLAAVENGTGKSSIRHYNFRRTITVEADLDKDQMDTLEANDYIKAEWQTMRTSYPRVDLDFSGELDDIQESMDSMVVLFLFGVGMMYLILGTQFKSYFQPFMILTTIPMAFMGVTFGLAVTGYPLSLFTLYGVVALTGIAVNAAIVMIDAGNNRLDAGMSLTHATIYAARRRVIPIIITSLTTIAGLFSLATGLGGTSLVWSPVASAIVWGLTFSTVLTLLVVPILFRIFMARSRVLRVTHSD